MSVQTCRHGVDHVVSHQQLWCGVNCRNHVRQDSYGFLQTKLEPINKNKAINLTYLNSDVGKSWYQLGVLPNTWVKRSVDDWGGADNTLFIGIHIHIMGFLPGIVPLLGRVRNTRGTGIGVMPRKPGNTLVSVMVIWKISKICLPRVEYAAFLANSDTIKSLYLPAGGGEKFSGRGI